MASLESLLTRSLTAQSLVGYVTDDKAIAMEIVFSPLVSTTTATSVTLTSATKIVLIDSVGSSGDIDFATYTNLGLLVDKINTLDNWKARILDGLRSTATASSVLIPDAAITAVTVNGESVYKVFIDQSEMDKIFYRVSMDRGVLNDDKGFVRTQLPKGGHRVKITGIKYSADISAAELGAIRIYEFDAVTLSETLVWSAVSVDDTVTTHDFTDFPIAATEGNDLVVAIVDGTSIADKATNFLQVDYIRE